MRFWIGLAALAATPALSQTAVPMPPPAADFAAMPSDRLMRELLGMDDSDPPCAYALPLLAEASRRKLDVPELEIRTRLSEIVCANSRFDNDTAYRVLSEHPGIEEWLNPNYVLRLTAAVGDAPTALARVRTVLLESEDAAAAELDSRALFTAMQSGGVRLGIGEQLDALALEAVKAGRLPKFGDDTREVVALRALAAAGSAAADHRAVNAALATLNAPYLFVTLLGERRFESIWPAVEERAGPGYATITAERLAVSKARYESDPADRERLIGLAHALYYDGRFDELIAFADKATSRADLVATMTESEGWTLNLKAYALDALGRRTEADAVFDLLARAATHHPSWGVNFVINRALRLVGQQRWTEGLAAAAEAKSIADTNGNAYARALVAKSHLCALEGLDRDGELNPHLATLEGTPEHPILLAEGLMCIGRDDDAAKLLIAAIESGDGRSVVLEELQPEAFDLFYTRSLLPQPRKLMDGHPALRAAFEQYARIIPETYWPAASLRR